MRDPAVDRLEAEQKHDPHRVMSKLELILQLIKIGLGLAFGAYFMWWSLRLLEKLH